MQTNKNHPQLTDILCFSRIGSSHTKFPPLVQPHCVSFISENLISRHAPPLLRLHAPPQRLLVSIGNPVDKEINDYYESRKLKKKKILEEKKKKLLVN